LLDLIQFPAEVDSCAVLKDIAPKKKAEALRERLRDTIGNMNLDQFLDSLSVADQTAHRPKVQPRDLDHPSFYWIFRNMDYDQWLAQDSKVLLLLGPANCAFGLVSSHILSLMEGGRFGKDRIVLSFFSPDGATRGSRLIDKQDSETTVAILVHTLLYQYISSEVISKIPISTASDFLCHLLDSIDGPRLLDYFKTISPGHTLAVIRRILHFPDEALCDALGKVLEGERDLEIVANVLDNTRGRESDFVTAVSPLIGRLNTRTSRAKALFTSGPADDSTLEGLPCIKIQYDKERKGSIVLSLNIEVSSVANMCRVP
jgi:hypothetical protein